MAKPSLARGVLAAALVAVACAPGPAVSADQVTENGPVAVQPPPTSGVLDYQLGAAYLPPAQVTVVTRDSTAYPAPDRYGICYVNGFQTQPGDRDLWLSPARRHLVLSDANGDPVADPRWRDEFLLDTSTAGRRDELAGIIGEAITRCADRGFKAVEVDNLDSYLRSGGLLTVSGNLAYAKLLSDRAHDRGLAIGQKNASEEAARAREEVGFDFAVSEECHAWEECSSYSEVYGANVINIEYPDTLRGTFADVCADPATPATTTLRDRFLVGPDDSAYVFDHC